MTNEIELKRMAEQGNDEAQYLLGSMYMDEYRVEDGMYWLKKSAVQGNGFAQDAVCLCYEYGIGVSKDKFQSNYWGKKAEENERSGNYTPDTFKLPKCVLTKLRELM